MQCEAHSECGFRIDGGNDRAEEERLCGRWLGDAQPQVMAHTLESGVWCHAYHKKEVAAPNVPLQPVAREFKSKRAAFECALRKSHGKMLLALVVVFFRGIPRLAMENALLMAATEELVKRHLDVDAIGRRSLRPLGRVKVGEAGIRLCAPLVSRTVVRQPRRRMAQDFIGVGESLKGFNASLLFILGSCCQLIGMRLL